MNQHTNIVNRFSITFYRFETLRLYLDSRHLCLYRYNFVLENVTTSHARQTRQCFRCISGSCDGNCIRRTVHPLILTYYSKYYKLGKREPLLSPKYIIRPYVQLQEPIRDFYITLHSPSFALWLTRKSRTK